MAPHSSTLAWKTPWTEEPGRLQSTGSLRVGHDWVTSLSRIGEGNGNPLQCSCLENPRDRGAWWAAVYEVAQNWTWLKRLSSSSSDKWHWATFHAKGCVNSVSKLLMFVCRNSLRIVGIKSDMWFSNILPFFVGFLSTLLIGFCDKSFTF